MFEHDFEKLSFIQKQMLFLDFARTLIKALKKNLF